TRNHIGDVRDLQPLYLADVVDWRNVGKVVVEDILINLVQVSITQPGTPEESGKPASQTTQHPAWVDELLDDVETLVEWNSLIGRHEAPMFELSSYAPESVAQARLRILNLTAEAAGEGQDHSTLIDLLNDLFSG